MAKKIKTPKDLIGKAERDALSTLSKRTKPKSGKGYGISTPTKYSRKIARFRKLSGRSRVTREERKALHMFTPKQVLNRKTTDTTAYYRRILKIYRDYVVPDELQEQVAYALEYLAPKQAAKRFGLEPITKNPVQEWDTFKPVDIRTISYSQHPGYMRKGKEIRRTGGYYYENISNGILDSSVPIGKYFEFEGGNIDYHGYTNPTDALQMIIDHISPGVLVDPGNSGHPFLVYKEEWDNAKELAPDYYESRHYIKK
jgi:hypothetical protein